MAPFISLVALLFFTTVVLASPHIPRHVHHHRGIAPIEVPKRALNKRCVPRPTNSTSVVPTSSAPINVAPVPSLFSSSLPSSSQAPSPPSSTQPSSTQPDSTSSLPPSSSYAPPPQTTTQAPSPTPTPSPTSIPLPPATTTSSPPAQTYSSGNSGSPSYMYGTQYGQGTYYEVGLGACGITNVDNQYIVAVSQYLFDTYPGYSGIDPNTNPVCGKEIVASYAGLTVTVTVQDRCVACNETSLDFSPSAFNVLANAAIGRIDITWSWKA